MQRSAGEFIEEAKKHDAVKGIQAKMSELSDNVARSDWGKRHPANTSLYNSRHCLLPKAWHSDAVTDSSATDSPSMSSNPNRR